MEKIVGQTLYNTNRDTKIIGNGLSVLFISSSEKYYLYFSEGKIIPLEKYEAVEWLKLNWEKMESLEIERVKKFINVLE